MHVIDDESFRGFHMDCQRPVIGALGFFDGLHRGHVSVIGRAVEGARRAEGRSLVLTFENHPAEVLSPGQSPPRLMSVERRASLIEQLGVDVLVMPRFTLAFSRMSAEEFADRILRDKLALTGIVVGENFRFGFQRQGDRDFLMEWGARRGIEVVVLPPVMEDGAPVSSTRVRRLLKTGQMEEATHLLGRPFEVEGPVVMGEQRGRLLGIPTLNLEVNEQAPLVDGVYVTRTDVGGRKGLPGVGYVGRKPTFHGELHRRVLEVHLLDFEGDIYGQKARVEVLKWLRGSTRFENPRDLVEQIRQDIGIARSYVAEGTG